MVGSNTWARRLPSAFARYIATSALRSSSSTGESPRTALIPALQPTMTSVALDPERELETRDDPLGHGQGVVDGRSGGGQERELVATETRHQVARPELLADPFGDGHEELVARGVTQRVVDDLEVVEVEEGHDRGRRPVDRGDPAPLDLLDEGGPVGQSGQRVVERLVAELLLEPRQLVERLLELAVLEGDRGLVGDRLEQAQVVGLEAVTLTESVDDRQGADDAALADERTDHRLADVVAVESSRRDSAVR